MFSLLLTIQDSKGDRPGRGEYYRMDIRTKLNQSFQNLLKESHGGEKKTEEKRHLSRKIDYMDSADPFWPDGLISQSVKDAMIASIEDGSAVHYTKSIGMDGLRFAITERIKERTGLDLHQDRNVLVTPGSQPGLFFAMMPFIESGDEVLVLNPCYPSNLNNPKLFGGKAISIPLYEQDNYQPRIDVLEKGLTAKSKMLVINQPNNPTTTVIRKETMEKLCEFVVKHDLILVCDQAFDDHIYDGIEFVSPATMSGMWERTITLGSISKGIGLSGFRIGYLYAGDEIMAVLHEHAESVLGPASTITSIGAIAALEDKAQLTHISQKMEKRRRVVFEIFSSIPSVEMKMPESGFLSWLNISKLGSSQEIATYLLREAGVAVEAGSHFGCYGEGYIRIVSGCFKEDEDAIEVFNRIKVALTKLAKEKAIR